MEEKKEENCLHICSGECRRSGCNCLCGEYHISNNSYPDDFISEEEQVTKEED